MTVTPRETVWHVVELLADERIGAVPVLDGDRIVGFVSIGDLVKSRLDQIEQEAGAMRAYIQGDYERHI